MEIRDMVTSLTEIDLMEMDNHINFAESPSDIQPDRAEKPLTLSGIMTIRNAIELGYPFLEAVLGILPMVDEFLIGDGGSTDATLYYIDKLRETFPKVKFYSTIWSESEHWESFDNALNFLISKAEGTWLWEVQSDEFWHETQLPALIDIIKQADREGYNSLRQPCILYHWTNRDSYIYKNIRILRKIPELSSHWGGDDFQVGAERSPRQGFTSHNVPPELDVDIEIMHMSRAFPRNRILQDETNVKFCGTKGESRQKVYERMKQIDWGQVQPPKEEEILDCLPAIMKGLGQELIYRVREELFDKEWLRKTTGLNYE